MKAIFNNVYGDNTWVFTGGEIVQGGFEQTAGIRNYVGHFEEYIRWAKAEENENALQRYVINTAKKGQTITDIVQNYNVCVEKYDPKTAAYMIGKEDYLLGSKALDGFKKNLNQFIENSLALRKNSGFVVIQTPYATIDDTENVKIEIYSHAAKEIVQKYGNDHIIVVDHFIQTNNDKFKVESLNSKGLLNAKGHFEIGKQLSMATIQTTEGYPGEKVTLNLKPLESLDQYLHIASLLEGKIEEVEEKQKKLKATMEQKKSMTWLFMGDSITHGALWTRGYDGITQLFEKFLKDDLGRIDDIVINTAVSGATTETTLDAIEERLEKYYPDVISIMLGANDVAAEGISEEVYHKNMKILLNRMKAKGAIVILRTPIPTKFQDRGEKLPSYIEKLKELAKDDSDIIFIDQYSMMKKAYDTYPYLWGEDYFYSDAPKMILHPGANGQLVMVKQFIRACGLWRDDSHIINLFYQMPFVTENVQMHVPVRRNGDTIEISISDFEMATGFSIGGVAIEAKEREGAKVYQAFSELGDMKAILKGLNVTEDYDITVTGYLRNIAKEIKFSILKEGKLHEAKD